MCADVRARRGDPIVVGGPLAPFADGMRADLLGQGYAVDTVCGHVRLLADLSDWLGTRDQVAADVTAGVVEAFAHERRGSGLRTGKSARGLAPVVDHLRRIGAAPLPVTVPETPMDGLLDLYRRHLEGERGLSPGTVDQYLRCARRFLVWLPEPLTQSLATLAAGRVTGYVLEWAEGRDQSAIDTVTAPALRSLLRFLHRQGQVPGPLTAAVPAVRRRPGAVAVPRAARHSDVAAVLAGCDREGAAGRRDYAMILIMTRLALRGGEVARLGLQDVNWQSGQLNVHGKGGRIDALPLPADVGQAMADYVMLARPTTTQARTIFVTLRAPYTAMTTAAVTWMVARACARVGVARFGPHGIRHATACGLLADGASMEEIGQLLRHAQQRTTALYAKVDTTRLAQLARPCPESAVR